MKTTPLITLALSSCTLLPAQAPQPPQPRPNPPLPYTAKVDPAIPSYQPVPGLSGQLTGVLSATLPGITDRWIAGFTKIYPKVKIITDLGGTDAGGPRLAEQTADFAFIARVMLGSNVQPFIDKFGYEPLQISVAGGSFAVHGFSDTMVFIVNKDNPINELSFTQLDAMYSLTRNRGGKEAITKWGQLGLTGDWADKPIHLWGVEIPNGFDTYVNIRVLANGIWRNDVQSLHTVGPLADKVAEDPYSISYTGRGQIANPNVKIIKLKVHDSDPAVEATFDTVTDQSYPLSRQVYIFVNKKPGVPLNPVLREFIRYAISREGQQAVVDDAIFTPLPASILAQQSAKLAEAECSK